MTVYKRKRLTVGSDVGVELEAPPPKTLPLAPPPAAPLALREVLQLPPSWLADLPLPTTLALTAVNGTECICTTSKAHYMRLREAGSPVVLRGSELGALAVGAENGRASPLWFAEWLEARAQDSTLSLTPAAALGAMAAPQTPSSRWWLSNVLHAWSIRLTAVGTGDGPDWL